MPLIKLNYKPGINKDQTDYSNEGGWVDGDKVRFNMGYPQKIGGWTKALPVQFLGLCRQMFRWVTTYVEDMLALGTHSKLYIEYKNTFYDITPKRATFLTPVTDDALIVTHGDTLVKVTLPGHGAQAGDYFVLSDVAPIGTDFYGIPMAEINKTQTVSVVEDANVFYFRVETSPVVSGGGSSAPSGGAAIEILFDVPIGRAITVPGYGWGTGAWSRGPWSSMSDTSLPLRQRDWWLDQFDNDLVAHIRDGPIYYWERGAGAQPDNALNTPAVLLNSLPGASHVPDVATQVMLSQDDRHLLAFGCTPYGGTGQDPLLIRWASQDDPLTWDPQVTNSAGFLRVSRGMRIICALPTRQEILVWTESSLSSLQFLGTTDVFGLQAYSASISITSARSVVSAKDIVYWMGRGQFYTYSGRVEPLPCTVQEHIFNNFNKDQVDQVFAVTNEAHHEIWWFYPTKDSNFNDRYVVYNYLEEIWYTGTISRTAWIDSSSALTPQATGYDSYLYNQETGVDADGQPMESFIKSAGANIADGNSISLTKRIIPDLTFRGSTAPEPEVTFKLYPRMFPGGGRVNDPADVESVVNTQVGEYTDQVFLRARARHIAIEVRSSGLGTSWQLGSPRIDVKPSGRR